MTTDQKYHCKLRRLLGPANAPMPPCTTHRSLHGDSVTINDDLDPSRSPSRQILPPLLPLQIPPSLKLGERALSRVDPSSSEPKVELTSLD